MAKVVCLAALALRLHRLARLVERLHATLNVTILVGLNGLLGSELELALGLHVCHQLLVVEALRVCVVGCVDCVGYVVRI